MKHNKNKSFLRQNKILLKRTIKKIQDIVVTNEQHEMIKKYKEIHLNWSRSTDYITFVRRDVKVGGVCCICDNLPSKLITFKEGFIERYCDKHLDKIKDDLNTDNINQKIIIKLRDKNGTLL